MPAKKFEEKSNAISPSADSLTNGNGLVETVLSRGGPSSGVQDVPMEDVDVVAVAEEAVEQDQDEDDEDEAQK